MCLVSVVTQGAISQLPPVSQWGFQQVSEMSKVIQLLESIDKKLGAKDCVDETKQSFLDELAERVKVLERIHPYEIPLKL
jgi:hypothetical protein